MRAIAVQRVLDRFAVAASGMCALHCLTTPLLLVVLPTLTSTILADETFHRLLLILVLPTSVIALSFGWRRHKDSIVVALGSSGLLQLSVTALWGHALFGEPAERISTVIASAVLSASHLRNHRLCRLAECRQ
jgi:hypothetical protein